MTQEDKEKECKKCGRVFGSAKCFDIDCPNNTPNYYKQNAKVKYIVEGMTRQEQIQNAAFEYAKKSIRDKSIAYLEFIEAVEWADRTLCEQIYNWLESNLKYNDNNLNILKQFDMDFLNKN